jgi:hypothetical protein
MPDAPATNQQVQTFSDTIMRPLSEVFRNLLFECQSCSGSIGSVYSALTEENPTWTDSRTDGPPNLLQPSDLLALNAFFDAFIAWAQGQSGWTVIMAACVRPVQI